MNIESDIVLEHGRWCLDRLADPRFLSRDTLAKERIEAIMDQRRDDIRSGRAQVCVGVSSF